LKNREVVDSKSWHYHHKEAEIHMHLNSKASTDTTTTAHFQCKQGGNELPDKATEAGAHMQRVFMKELGTHNKLCKFEK
jgi:hypothetical protein